MADGDPLPDAGRVLRLPSIKAYVHQSGANRKPEPAAFTLSGPERELRKQGVRVHVSVWDAGRIDVATARSLRGGERVDVFMLKVDAVRAISIGRSYPELDVIEDREGATGAALEHREAHAGIKGLDTRAPVLDEIRELLARACNAVVDG